MNVKQITTRSGRISRKPSNLEVYRDDEESKALLGKRNNRDEYYSSSDDYIDNHISKQQNRDN